jgi:hypothetical protein
MQTDDGHVRRYFIVVLDLNRLGIHAVNGQLILDHRGLLWFVLVVIVDESVDKVEGEVLEKIELA